MIKRLIISNYKSLGANTIIDLEKLTVFVGPNGSGKSNIIDIFRFLSDCMQIGLEGAITKRNGIKSVRKWSSGKPTNISIRVEITDSTFNATYLFEVSSHKKHDYVVSKEYASITDFTTNETHQYSVVNQKWQNKPSGVDPKISPLNLVLPIISGDERFKRLEATIRNISIYNIYPDTLRIPQKYDPSKPMQEQGINWVSILKDQDISTWKDDFISGLKVLTKEIDDIEIKPVSGYLIARFRHGVFGESKKAKWFEASSESDGTLRTAGILTALLQIPRLPLIGIEEPELTIHPGAISLLYDYLTQASSSSQIVITTHSPELLDRIKDTEAIRVISKDSSTTFVSGMSSDQIESIKSGLLSIGEIHRTEGIIGAKQIELDFK